MNGISLDNLPTLQRLSSNNVQNGAPAAGGLSFSALLEESLSENASLFTDSVSPSDLERSLLLGMCLSMFGGVPAIFGLYAALAGKTDPTQEDDPIGKSIVDAAMSRLGDPYSKTYRGSGNYVDCSYLAQWAYKQAGISIPGTAAAQAKYCYENGFTISKSELKPGDLIFWENTQSDTRWRHIHHVGIYAGNGKVVEAKGTKKGVEIDDIWESGKWKIVMYARPRAKASA